MLSTKVIYAIEVLAELANARPNRNGKRVAKRRDMELQCGMDPIISSLVFNTLHKYEYIDRSSTGYMPLKELQKIDLYELIELFHGGVVVGEMVNTMYSKGNYRKLETYAPLVTFEKELNSELVKRFKKVKVADLIEKHLTNEN